METASQNDNAAEIRVNGLRVKGVSSSHGVSRFLGIPYARVVQRFHPAQSVDLASLGSEFDAIRFAPRCPQSWNHGPQRRKHLYQGIPLSSSDPVSEVNCLNLNVYTPEQAASNNQKLPVLVWIHGGGWVFGDGGSEYDGSFLVQEASRIGKPFVFVTLNYRLGYYGFLTSRELKMEAEANNQEYYPNLGLYDQRLALQWVQNNISYFGGDPQEVTIAGQSAGAWSALSHLVTDVPLCKRGFIMSATVISFATEDENQEMFDKLVKRAGISHGATYQEKLATLRSLSDDQMTEWLDGAVLIRPSWDPKWFSRFDGPSRLDQVKCFPDWVNGLVIGSTRDETANIKPFWQPFSAETIVNAVKSVVLDQDICDELLQTYSMSSATQEQVLQGLLDLTTESFFGLFPQALGEMRAPISVYRFEQQDTFDESIYKGQSYHCLDLPFLCRLPAVADPRVDASMKATSQILTESVAMLVSGELPWEPFHVLQKVMVINGHDSELKQWPDNERWRRFFTTPDRSRVLVDTGRLLMTYDLNGLTQERK
ncbi:hypothetical protein LTS17_007711 [Exophiala oligosperma]